MKNERVPSQGSKGYKDTAQIHWKKKDWQNWTLKDLLDRKWILFLLCLNKTSVKEQATDKKKHNFKADMLEEAEEYSPCTEQMTRCYH